MKRYRMGWIRILLLTVVCGVLPMAGCARGAAWERETLRGEWIEIGGGESAAVLEFGRGRMQHRGLESLPGSYAYQIPDAGHMDVWAGDESWTYVFHLHWEEVGGETIPILSEIVEELDGRGLIVLSEFVRTEDADKLPRGYVSSLAGDDMSGELDPVALLDWTGCTLEEVGIVPDSLHDANGVISVGIEGYFGDLFTVGSAYLIPADVPEDMVVDTVTLLVSEGEFESLRDLMAEHYGSPDDEGEEPLDDGMGVKRWCEWQTERYTLHMEKRSTRGSVSLETVRKEEP